MRAPAPVGPGDTLPEVTLRVTRLDLVRYAGASGDFNLIHWSERAALAAGLPGVISHGMLTMAKVAQYVVEWSGDPTAVVDFGVRFSQPLVVPDDDEGAKLVLRGHVESVDELGSQATVLVYASSGGHDVLKDARAVVRVPRDVATPGNVLGVGSQSR